MAISSYDCDFSGEKKEKTINNEIMENKEVSQESEERKQNILVKERTLHSLSEKNKIIDSQINGLKDSKFECWKELRNIELKRKYSLPVVETVYTVVVSTVLSFIFGLAGKFVSEANEMKKHSTEILQAQQEYTNQVVSDMYNQFGLSFVPTADSIVAQISHYADSPLLGHQTSQYFSTYAHEVQNTLVQIAYDISGADGTMVGVACAVGTFGVMFGGHIICSNLTKYHRRKKFTKLHNEMQNIDKKIDSLREEKEDVLFAYNQIKNSTSTLSPTTQTQLAEEEKKEQQEMGL